MGTKEIFFFPAEMLVQLPKLCWKAWRRMPKFLCRGKCFYDDATRRRAKDLVYKQGTVFPLQTRITSNWADTPLDFDNWQKIKNMMSLDDNHIIFPRKTYVFQKAGPSTLGNNLFLNVQWIGEIFIILSLLASILYLFFSSSRVIVLSNHVQ